MNDVGGHGLREESLRLEVSIPMQLCFARPFSTRPQKIARLRPKFLIPRKREIDMKPDIRPQKISRLGLMRSTEFVFWQKGRPVPKHQSPSPGFTS